MNNELLEEDDLGLGVDSNPSSSSEDIEEMNNELFDAQLEEDDLGLGFDTDPSNSPEEIEAMRLDISDEPEIIDLSCGPCGGVFENVQRWAVHNILNHPLKCVICVEAQSSTLELLSQHCVLQHSKETVITRACRVCGEQVEHGENFLGYFGHLHLCALEFDAENQP